MENGLWTIGSKEWMQVEMMITREVAAEVGGYGRTQDIYVLEVVSTRPPHG